MKYVLLNRFETCPETLNFLWLDALVAPVVRPQENRNLYRIYSENSASSLMWLHQSCGPVFDLLRCFIITWNTDVTTEAAAVDRCLWMTLNRLLKTAHLADLKTLQLKFNWPRESGRNRKVQFTCLCLDWPQGLGVRYREQKPKSSDENNDLIGRLWVE